MEHNVDPETLIPTAPLPRRTWDNPSEREGTLAALITQQHPQHDAAVWNVMSALETPSGDDYLYALSIAEVWLNAKRADVGLPMLVPEMLLPILRQAERQIEQLEAKQRDLELQRDELLRFVLKARTALRAGPRVTAEDIDAVMAYCEEFTPAERAEDELEQYAAQTAHDEAVAARYGG